MLESAINAFIESVNKFNEYTVRIDLKENEPLDKHSTFKIGGPARLFAVPEDIDALSFLLAEAKKQNVRSYVIGNGSNILFDDDGFDGVIISTAKFNKISFEGNVMCAEAGAMLSACAVLAKERSLSGLECLFGIPGSIGGAVYMNAGAYGGEISQVAVETVYLDPETYEIKTVNGEEHKFGYRHSIFKENGGIILKTYFNLNSGDITDICSAMDGYKCRRIDKQPLEYPSAGSTFKRYPGRYTGQMIDECGLKGYSIGGAQVSEKHAGFVINTGSATSKDVLSLIEHIKTVIRERYDIEIETEVIYVK